MMSDSDPFAPPSYSPPSSMPASAPRLSDLARPVPPYLDGLNPEQRAAVEQTDGPVLVLAGAGTGKTRVLTTRLAHILSRGLAKPWEILCVTFTNKAAREMRERITGLIGPSAEGLSWLGTFHSVAAQILRRHAELVGLKSTFTILDDDDQQRLIKQILEAEKIDTKRWTPKTLAHLIDGWKNKGLTPDKVPAGDMEFGGGQAARLYGLYQDRLAILNACDFGDLLLHNLTLLAKNPDILALYHDRFRYVMVDEYQDTNVAQYLWLRLLTSGRRNVCCVGDDDQSIYGWRGAEVDNILKFERDFPGATVIRLERNYRSTAHILGAAAGLIRGNRARLGKTLWTEAEGGSKVQVRGVWDGEAEARMVGEEMEMAHKAGRAWADMAILVRASFQMRAFEERLVLLQIPYQVIGGPRFFERAEIRDAHAYLRLIQSPDDDLAFERIINVPKRGLGDTTVQKLLSLGRARGVSAVEAARALIQTDELTARSRTPLANFLRDLDRWRDEALKLDHDRLLELVLEESGYVAMQRADKTSGETRLENLKELVQSMGAFDNLETYLEHISLVMDLEREAGADSVRIMTLHGSKGLEFPLVFLPGWEEGVFPSQRSVDENGERGLEEERRLAYVGLTRAREEARISFVANRQVYGRWTTQLPSRFVDELPVEHVEAASVTGYYGGGMAGTNPARSQFEDLDSGGGYSSPGWQRARERGAGFASGGNSYGGPVRSLDASGGYRRGQTVLEGKVTSAGTVSGESGFSRGQRVFHLKFGYGLIKSVDGNKLIVAFDKAGEKKVIDSFVEKA
ncbi:MAG: ATP-dependent helicase [Asticcacaulis sp.]